MKYWGKLGAVWGGFWGLLIRSWRLRYSGDRAGVGSWSSGRVWIVGALEGAAVMGGLTAVGAGLYSIGIPKDSVMKYESALKADKFILLAHGTAAEVAKAKDIMQTTHPTELALHGTER